MIFSLPNPCGIQNFLWKRIFYFLWQHRYLPRLSQNLCSLSSRHNWELVMQPRAWLLCGIKDGAHLNRYEQMLTQSEGDLTETRRTHTALLGNWPSTWSGTACLIQEKQKRCLWRFVSFYKETCPHTCQECLFLALPRLISFLTSPQCCLLQNDTVTNHIVSINHQVSVFPKDTWRTFSVCTHINTYTPKRHQHPQTCQHAQCCELVECLCANHLSSLGSEFLFCEEENLGWMAS